MAVAVRSVTFDGEGNTPSATVTKPAGTIEDDLLVAVATSDNDGSLAAMTAPAGWAESGTGVGGTAGTAFMKTWRKVATASEPADYTFPDSDGAHAAAVILCLTGVDTTTPIAVDATYNVSTSDSTSHPAPSVAGVADGLLITAHCAEVGGTSRTYTPPSGMTEQADFNSTASPWLTLEVNTLALTADGATGTKTATCSGAEPFTCMSLVVAAGSTIDKTGGAASAAAGMGAREMGAGDVRLPANPGELLWIGPTSGKRHFNVGIGIDDGSADGYQTGDTIHTDQADIENGYTWGPPAEPVPKFVLTSDRTAVQFRIGVNDGRTSSGTSYPRSELREQFLNGDLASWDGSTGTHYQRWWFRATHVAATKPWVCMGQIHDSSSDLCRLQTESGGTGSTGLRLRFRHTPPGGTETAYQVMAAYEIDQWVRGELLVVDGDLTLALDGVIMPGELNGLTLDAATPGCYFKAGCYGQSNTDTENGDDTQYFSTEIKNLDVWHTGDPAPTTPTYTGPLVTADTGGAVARGAGSGAKEVVPGSTVYEETGGASAAGAGSGAKTVTPATVHVKTGGGAATGAGSGAKVVDEPAVHVKAGGAAATGAGTGAREYVRSKTGGATAAGAGSGAREHVRPRTGGAAASGAGSGSRVLDLPRSGGAAAVGAGSGARTLAHTRTGGGAAAGAGSGASEVVTVAIHTKTGGAAAVGAGSGAREHVRPRTGGAAAIGAGTGARTVSPATVHEKTGGAAATGAGIGHAVIGGAIEYSKTGGAAADAAGSGAAEVQHPTTHDRSGGAAAVGTGTAAREYVRSRSGGAAAAGAGAGDAEVVPPAVHVRAGGAAATGAGIGRVDVAAAGGYDRSGGAAAHGAGSGSAVVQHPAVHEKSGGAAASGAGIALKQVIPPAVYVRAGGAVAIGAGTGRGRVGGTFHAGTPRLVGTQHAGTPIAVGQHHAGPETTT